MDPLTSIQNNKSEAVSSKSIDIITQNQQSIKENSVLNTTSASVGQANTKVKISKVKSFGSIKLKPEQ